MIGGSTKAVRHGPTNNQWQQGDSMATTQAPLGRADTHKPAAPPERRRPSDFACKQVIAVTGLVFGVFVLVHMLGNLKAYLGRQGFDSYAVWLRHLLEPVAPYSGVLWVVRAVLLACLVGHVGCAYLLWRRARIARGPFRRKGLPLRSFGARTMPVTGVVLLLFIIFHILDLTTGTRPVVSSEYTPMTSTRSFAYDNLVHSFDRPWVSAFYIFAMLLLALHLSHGLWTAVNDLGATGHRVRQVARVAAGVLVL